MLQKIYTNWQIFHHCHFFAFFLPSRIFPLFQRLTLPVCGAPLGYCFCQIEMVFIDCPSNLLHKKHFLNKKYLTYKFKDKKRLMYSKFFFFFFPCTQVWMVKMVHQLTYLWNVLWKYFSLVKMEQTYCISSCIF